MTYFSSWEEFAKAVERLYAANPSKCRFVTKYNYAQGRVVIKMTDDVVCLQFGTKQVQDVRRLEKLTAQLMRTILGGASS